MDSFVVRPLDPTQLHAAYPLIRQVAPSVDLNGWRKFAKRATDPRFASQRGVIVAHRSNRPHPSGLFCYVKEQDLHHGAVLFAKHFIVLDMFDPQAVFVALVGALEGLGRQLNCSMVRSTPSGDLGDLSKLFMSSGHEFEGAVFSKMIASTPLN